MFLLVDEVGRLEATEIASLTSASLGLGCNVSLHFRGQALSPGRHEIVIGFVTSEVGEVKLPLRDSIEG
ncbi:MAG: hypothetical protein CEE40_07850 [Chloroflexi bacterium B3_Chlor]|nr:MAG: hypothetical protein CEE40_07850 [Chloroflexi bacterium B3_Chlor]